MDLQDTDGSINVENLDKSKENQLKFNQIDSFTKKV